jgi:hypothetical protein
MAGETAGLTDHFAAVDISRRSAVNPLIVVREEAKAILPTELRQSLVTSYSLKGVVVDFVSFTNQNAQSPL